MRVLIVEDDVLTAFDLQSLVEDLGHRVVGPCEDLSAARRCVGEDLDFAFLDVDLPDGKSFEIASRLRERGVPFVFVSASRRGDLPAHLRHVPFIPKPYPHAAIRDSLDLSRRLAS